MSEQLQHHHNRFTKKQFPITLVCDMVQSPANIGSLFRIADSFGIEHIYFCGEDLTIISNRMRRTARATHEIISYSQADDILAVIKQLTTDGYRLLALEITENSIPISEYHPKPGEKIALVIGEENYGVSPEVIAAATQVVHINMYGTNSSMNVATATGIALYEITKKYVSV